MNGLKVIVLLGLVGLFACGQPGAPGSPCKFKLESSKNNAKELKEKARVIEYSFECIFPYCIVNYHDPKNEGMGYCTRICETKNDCPSGDYDCLLYMKVKELPPDYQQFSKLIGKKLCVRTKVPGS